MLIVNLMQKLQREFGLGKEMFVENEQILSEMSGSIIFVGSDRDNDDTKHIIMNFSSPDALRTFASHDDFKAKRAAAEVVLDPTAVTTLSSETFTSIT